mgnify:CR=1 FL=1
MVERCGIPAADLTEEQLADATPMTQLDRETVSQELNDAVANQPLAKDPSENLSHPG